MYFSSVDKSVFFRILQIPPARIAPAHVNSRGQLNSSQDIERISRERDYTPIFIPIGDQINHLKSIQKKNVTNQGNQAQLNFVSHAFQRCCVIIITTPNPPPTHVFIVPSAVKPSSLQHSSR